MGCWVAVHCKILHHLRDSDDGRGFRSGDPLRLAIEFDDSMHVLDAEERQRLPLWPDGVEGVLHTIGCALWMAPRYGGEPKQQWVRDYRQRYRYRLNVGDVVVVGEQAWAVKGSAPPKSGVRGSLPDWEPVSLMESRIITA